jgi:hypothetical protein
MLFGHAERRKEHDNQLNNVAREANASFSSSSWFHLVLTKSIKPSTDLEQAEGLFPKMGACGWRNKINQSLELINLKIVGNAGDNAMMPWLGFFYGKLP